MKFVASQREVSLFLGATTLVALLAILLPGPGGGWVLESLSGIVTAAAIIAVCVRLALGVPNPAARHFWLAVLALLGLLCLSRFVESFGDVIAVSRHVDVGDYLMLAAAPVMWLTARHDPIPRGPYRLFLLAFVVQLVGTAIELAAGDRTGGASGPWRIETDLFDLISVQLYLLGVAWFVARLRWRMLTIDRRPSDVGDLARYLFVSSRLFKKQRHPRIAGFALPGGKLVFDLGRFLSWFPHMAPRVRARFGLGLWRQLRDICAIALRHGLDTQAYYMFELYRDEVRARASGFLTRYETKNGLFKVLTWQVPKSRRRIVLGDKLGMYRLFRENVIPCVPILIIAEDGKLQFEQERPSDLERDLFIKPRKLKGARGTEIVRYAGGRYTTASGAGLSRDELLEYLAARSREAPVLVQPLIVNHPELADLAGQALLPLRVITCLDEAGRPAITHAFLRVMCKLEPDWRTNVELGAPIDLGRGTLGRMTGDKAEMWLDWYDDHPVTHARVLGRAVPHWDEVRRIVLAAHDVCRDRLLIGWDVAICPDGPLLLEGNSYADVDFPQRVHRCAIGDSPLGPILYARLVDLERRIATGTMRGPLDYEQAEGAALGQSVS